MPDKPEIDRIRALHELQNKFDVSEAIRSTLESQLSNPDIIDRFVRGFKIEDWFQWIFSPMPWIKLIHGLDQQQFPSWSKKEYQVPDFLLLVETSALTIKPLLVEVKSVPMEKMTLKLQKSQVELCRAYAMTVGIPLVFVIYWEKLRGWTMNTPDSFEAKSSTYKIGMLAAFELDCSGILGDISYLVPQSLVRASRFTKKNVKDDVVRHKDYGRLLSDVVYIGDKSVDMSSLESAAIDSMMTMKRRKTTAPDSGETEIVETPDDNYLLKLSSWITRHLAIFNAAPSETLANTSAHAITELTRKLGCFEMHMFPSNRTEELKLLDAMFRTSAIEPGPNDSLA